MSIANKLIYLNTTKEKLKDSINNIGGSITDETTFRAYAEELDNIYTNLPKTTGEGSNLSLTTLKGRINVDDILGDTTQDTYEGYNLLPVTTPDGTYYGVTFKNNDDGTITLNGTPTTSNAINIFEGEISLSGDYVFYLYGNDGSISCSALIDNTTTTLFGFSSSSSTTTKNYTSSKMTRFYLWVTPDHPYTNKIIKPMLVKGTDTTKLFQKYVGGIASPNPSYPQDIEVVTGTQEVFLSNKPIYYKDFINLPNTYQAVEYIESTGPAYIDTGVIPNTNSKIDIQFETIQKGTNGVIFGGEEAFGTNAFHLYTNYNNFDIGFGARYTAETIPYNINTKYTFIMDKTGFTLNGTPSIPFSPNTITTTNSVYLFAVHRATNVIDSNAQKRIYYCKLYDNGTLVRNLIPCYRISDNTIGMYDLVNNVFYTNAGTGTFTKGDDLQSQTKTLHLSSKNLFDENELEIGSINVTTGQNLASTTEFRTINYIEASNVVTLSNYNYLGYTARGIFEYDSNKNYIKRTNDQVRSETTPFTLNLDTNTKYIRIRYAGGSTITTIPTNMQIQLELGSSATTYEPYYNYELSKIGTYQDKLKKTTGKNYVDQATELRQGGTTVADNTRVSISVKKQLKANTTYTLISNLSTSFNYAFVLGTKVAPWGANQQLFDSGWQNASTYYSYTTTQDCYINIPIRKTNNGTITPSEIENFSFMLYEGAYDSSIEIEPYGSDKWYIEKNIRKYAINGASGSYSKPSTNRFNIDGALTDYLKEVNVVTCLADKYVCYAQKGSNNDFNTLVANENFGLDLSSSTSGNTIRIKDTNYDDINQFKTWLASNNVELLYVLATPTYEEITNETLLNELNELEKMMSYNGQTNISISGNLPMILDVTALKGE